MPSAKHLQTTILEGDLYYFGRIRRSLFKYEKVWKKRWGVLTTENLYLFENEEQKMSKSPSARKSFTISDVLEVKWRPDLENVVDRRLRQYHFSLRVQDGKFETEVLLCANTWTELRKWMHFLPNTTTAISSEKHPLDHLDSTGRDSRASSMALLPSSLSRGSFVFRSPSPARSKTMFGGGSPVQFDASPELTARKHGLKSIAVDEEIEKVGAIAPITLRTPEVKRLREAEDIPQMRRMHSPFHPKSDPIRSSSTSSNNSAADRTQNSSSVDSSTSTFFSKPQISPLQYLSELTKASTATAVGSNDLIVDLENDSATTLRPRSRSRKQSNASSATLLETVRRFSLKKPKAPEGSGSADPPTERPNALARYPSASRLFKGVSGSSVTVNPLSRSYSDFQYALASMDDALSALQSSLLRIGELAGIENDVEEQDPKSSHRSRSSSARRVADDSHASSTGTHTCVEQGERDDEYERDGDTDTMQRGDRDLSQAMQEEILSPTTAEVARTRPSLCSSRRGDDRKRTLSFGPVEVFGETGNAMETGQDDEGGVEESVENSDSSHEGSENDGVDSESFDGDSLSDHSVEDWQLPPGVESVLDSQEFDSELETLAELFAKATSSTILENLFTHLEDSPAHRDSYLDGMFLYSKLLRKIHGGSSPEMDRLMSIAGSCAIRFRDYTNADNMLDYARWLYLKKDLTGAGKAFARAYIMAPNSVDIIYSYGSYVHMVEKDYDQAKLLYNVALSLSAQENLLHIPACYNLAMLLLSDRGPELDFSRIRMLLEAIICSSNDSRVNQICRQHLIHIDGLASRRTKLNDEYNKKLEQVRGLLSSVFRDLTRCNATVLAVTHEDNLHVYHTAPDDLLSLALRAANTPSSYGLDSLLLRAVDEYTRSSTALQRVCEMSVKAEIVERAMGESGKQLLDEIKPVLEMAQTATDDLMKIYQQWKK